MHDPSALTSAHASGPRAWAATSTRSVKACLPLILVLLVPLMVCVPSLASVEPCGDFPKVQVIVDGRRLSMDAPPLLINGRTMVPIRELCALLGAEVAYTPDPPGVVIQSANVRSQRAGFIAGLMVVGLSFEIFGAVFLARGYMTKKIVDIFHETATYYGYNRYLQASLVQQREEARLGGICLVVGFICQTVASVEANSLSWGWILIPAPVIAILWLVSDRVVRRIVIRDSGRFIRTKVLKEMDRYTPQQAGPHLATWGRLTDIPRLEEEPDLDYYGRLREVITAHGVFPSDN